MSNDAITPALQWLAGIAVGVGLPAVRHILPKPLSSLAIFSQTPAMRVSMGAATVLASDLVINVLHDAPKTDLGDNAKILAITSDAIALIPTAAAITLSAISLTTPLRHSKIVQLGTMALGAGSAAFLPTFSAKARSTDGSDIGSGNDSLPFLKSKDTVRYPTH